MAAALTSACPRRVEVGALHGVVAAMDHESKNRNECLETAAADRNGVDPALAALVRCLAQIAAEQDYARHAGHEKADATDKAKGAP